jgi:HTH-type transcriptional regulator/antitoxin HigA
MMTIRGGGSDIFWFSLFHELGHILLHTQREVFLEDGYSDPVFQKQEDEADGFARDFLINKEDYGYFVEEGNFSKQAVLLFAKEQGIKPSIVVGRLMHEEFVKFNDYRLNSLRDKYKWS